MISAISLMAMMALLMPLSVFAIDIEADLITSVTLTVDDGDSPTLFEPSVGELLQTAVAFNTAELVTTGHVLVKQDATTVHTLVSWTDDALLAGLASVPDWNGADIDATPEAEAICGALGGVCPDGDYSIEVHVEYTVVADTLFETVTEAFSIHTTPASVDVSAFAVAPSPFDPITAAQAAEVSFTIDDPGFVSVNVYDDADSDFSDSLKTLVDNQNLVAGAYTSVEIPALAWNGTDTLGALLPNEIYKIQITTTILDGGPVSDTQTASVTLTAVPTITLDSFTVLSDNGTSTFDPAPSADNEDLAISYTLSEAMDAVNVDIKNSDNEVVKNFNSVNSNTGVFSWNGINIATGKLVLPGTYTIEFTATDVDQPDITDFSKTATVQYDSASKASINSFTINPSSFDPDIGDTEIAFTNSQEADEITVEIYNDTSALVRTFDNYDGDSYDADDDHSIVWNGKNDSDAKVSEGVYTISIITRNLFGVVSTSGTVTVDDSGGSGSSSNSHISGIDFNPSSKFEPGTDEEFEIEFDVEKELDILEIYAVQGSTEIKLYDEEDIDEENNVEITWDGTDDDDDYVSGGDWRIEFRSSLSDTNLTAYKSFEIEYDKPEIEELEVSKSKFDNELKEFTYILFKIEKEDAIVEIQVLEDNEKEDTIVEDMEVEANKWYAVEWDGGNFDYNDNLDIKLIAYNVVQKDVYDTEKTNIDLDEDEVSSSKSNVTNDYITPILTDGEGNMVLNYELEDDADVEVSIHKGKSSSGTKMIEFEIDDQDSGPHTIEWNGKDDDGDDLNSGFYTYKIKSKKTSTETETGLFVVGDVGDIDGSSADGGDSSSTVSSSVIIDGVSISTSGTTSSSNDCGGYTDANNLNDDELCNALAWVTQQSIFEGYANGTFGVYSPINRAEALKVIMEAFGYGQSSSYNNTTLGFSDVIVGSWYMPYIDNAMDLGIFNGDSNATTARPESYVNRAETLKMTLETLDLVSSSFSINDCSFTYLDVNTTAWYNKYVCESAKYDLFDAINIYYFSPEAYATRGEIALMFYRLNQAGLIQ